LKAKNGWSDKNFTSLLQLLGNMLSTNNELPDSTYKVKKTIVSFGYGVTLLALSDNENVSMDSCYGWIEEI
jgi:hypothetical protein